MKKVLLILLLIVSTFGLTGCVSSSIYSDAAHLRRIARRVEKRYMGKDSEYTSFELYKIYNENDEFKYVLVEFEPYGYTIVKIEKEAIIFNFPKGLYTRFDGDDWFRYIWVDNSENLEVKQYFYNSKGIGEGISNFRRVQQYEYNVDGSLKVYNESPYKVANVLNEKLYLLDVMIESSKERIIAVKRGDKFLNLISMQEFELQDKYVGYELSCIQVDFIYGFYLQKGFCIKKIILIILILSCLIIFCTGCSDRKYLEDDFELIFTVDKENVKITEEVKITATFKNNSRKGLFIKLGRPFYK